MQSIEIVNLKDYLKFNSSIKLPSNITYIGRKSAYHKLEQSLLANPFILDTKNSRSDIIRQYEDWLRKEIAKKSVVFNYLKVLKEKPVLVLGCWCKPLACHGDVIKKVLNEM